MISVNHFWCYWEPKLYAWYYRLPWPSYARKRALILFLHQRFQWLTRDTASYRLQQRAQSGGVVTHAELEVDYMAWRQRHVELGAFRQWRIAKTVRRWVSPSPLTLIVCTNGATQEALQATIASIRRQLYPHWELWVVGTDVGANDIRSGASFTQALAESKTDYVSVLEAGDILHEAALYYMAEAIRRHPDSALLYSDEDRIGAHGRRVTPYFKPDWNPELALSHDLIGSLALYHREVLRNVAMDEADPVWAYDLALQVSEHLPDSAIRHVPRVLCSRPAERVIPVAAVAAAAQRALLRRGIAAEVELSPLAIETIRVRYRLPQPEPLVSLIIPTRNTLILLRQCLDSLLRRTDYTRYELLVVDNDSDEPETLTFLDALPERYANVRVLRAPGPFNYSRLNNLAARQARGELIGLLNNDVEILDSGWLRELVSQACRPQVGAVGARLLYPDGRLQHAGVIVGLGQAAGHVLRFWDPDMADHFGPPGIGRSRLVQNLSAVTAACLVVRKALYMQVGGLDEVEFPVAYNDVDFCLKLRQSGYRNVYTPFATLIHHESASRGLDHVSQEKSARFARELANLQRRWATSDFTDPAYNPNFCVMGEDCAYSFPPRL